MYQFQRNKVVSIPIKREKCVACGTTVYASERLQADSKVYHTQCFRCKQCNTSLTLLNYSAFNGEVYCKKHWKIAYDTFMSSNKVKPTETKNESSTPDDHKHSNEPIKTETPKRADTKLESLDSETKEALNVVLKDLEELRDAGIMSKEEFESKREQIIQAIKAQQPKQPEIQKTGKKFEMKQPIKEEETTKSTNPPITTTQQPTKNTTKTTQPTKTLQERSKSEGPIDIQIEQDITGFENATHCIDCFQKGNKHFLDKEYEKAIEMYNQCERSEPTFPYAYYNRGLAEYHLNKISVAMDDFTKTISLQPKYTRAIFMQGNCLKVLKKYADAIQSYSEALSLDGTLTDGYLHRAMCYLQLGKTTEALEDYSKMISLNPTCMVAVYNSGQILFNTKQYKEAIDRFTRVIGAATNDSEFQVDSQYLNIPKIENLSLKDSFMVGVYTQRGKCFEQLGHLGKAEDDFKKVVSYYSKDPFANRWLATMLLEKKKYREAIVHLDRVLEINPKDIYCLYNRGVCKLELKPTFNTQSALSDFAQCCKLDPNHWNAHIQSMRCCQELSDTNGVINYITGALKIKEDAGLYFNRGTMYSCIDKIDEAISDFSKSIQLDNTNVEAYYNRAVLYYQKLELQNSLDDYTKVINLSKQPDAEVYFNRATVYYRLQKDEEAKRDLEQVLKLMPDHEMANKIYKELTQ